MVIERVWRWFDDRLGATSFGRSVLDKIFPDHWSFMLGEIALYCFVVLVLTGVYLTLFFTPSGREVVYEGSYGPLQGVSMSEAYESAVRLSFDVRAGLVIRQMHHWAALVFLGAVVLHVCRIFFTGAFRRPREINWLIGVTLLLLALFNGLSGYSLPDDLLSGTGLRIMYSIVLSIPVLGPWAASLLFGGDFPSATIISRFFVLHILFGPALIAGLLGAHLSILWRQKHTQFPGRGRTEHNIVGSRLWPTYAARSVGLFFGVAGLLALLGGLAQINPIWAYGPYEPAAVTTAAQPDWYMGWLEGALRIFPGWRVHVFGYTIPELFWPGILLPGVLFGLLYSWPFLEAKVTGDRRDHELLDRPSERPVRTAIGAATLTLLIVLFFAGSQDLIAQRLSVSIPPVTWTFRVLALVLPLVAAGLAWKLCSDLRGREELERDKEEIRDRIAGAGAPSMEAGGPSGVDGEHAVGAPAQLLGRLKEEASGMGLAALAAALAAGGRWYGRHRGH